MPSMYERPNKPKFTNVRKRERLKERDKIVIPDILKVDKFTECHVTPESKCKKMIDNLDLSSGHSILEPEAGTGNIVVELISRVSSDCKITAVERNYQLSEFLSKRIENEEKVKVINSCFFEYSEKLKNNKFDRIIMNPPFKKHRQHLESAIRLLEKGGVLIALVPVSYEYEGMQVIENLDSDTFANASVWTKIIKIVKTS